MLYDSAIKGMKHCEATGMLYFKDERASKDWNERNGSLPVLARWRCRICGGVHHWSTEAGDNNGGHRAGTMTVPQWVRDACDKSPEVFVLVLLDRHETGGPLAQAQRNQDKHSEAREQVKAGTHKRQTKAAREAAAGGGAPRDAGTGKLV